MRRSIVFLMLLLAGCGVSASGVVTPDDVSSSDGSSTPIVPTSNNTGWGNGCGSDVISFTLADGTVWSKSVPRLCDGRVNYRTGDPEESVIQDKGTTQQSKVNSER